MRFRKLRTAWSVAWGVVAVLVIALWVRSYWYVDGAFFKISNSDFVMLASVPGSIGVNFLPEEFVPLGTFSQPSMEWLRHQGGRTRLGFLIAFQMDKDGILAPHWFWGASFRHCCCLSLVAVA
jgi:hypothetical protein